MPAIGASSWAPYVRLIGVPTSATHEARSSSACDSIAACSCRMQRRRKAWSVLQVVSSNARRAAEIAASMSAGPPSAATPITSPVAGLTLS
jgi:hypothetical protein